MEHQRDYFTDHDLIDLLIAKGIITEAEHQFFWSQKRRHVMFNGVCKNCDFINHPSSAYNPWDHECPGEDK